MSTIATDERHYGTALGGDRRAAIRMRTSLADSRRRLGLDFDAAWAYGLEDALPGPMDPTERMLWRRAFAATRSAWEAAYTRQGAPLSFTEELVL